MIAVTGYPFVRCIANTFDEDGPHTFVSWRPGVDNRLVYPDDCEAYANGTGLMLLTVVSTHKPGRFPERVFYTREWEDPHGRRFGKPRLLIATRQKFTRLCNGYAVPFALDPSEHPEDVRLFYKEQAAFSTPLSRNMEQAASDTQRRA